MSTPSLPGESPGGEVPATRARCGFASCRYGWSSSLTCRPSSKCGPDCSTTSTHCGSRNLTKPNPRDLPVVAFFMTTQSTTSPYRLKYFNMEAGKRNKNTQDNSASHFSVTNVCNWKGAFCSRFLFHSGAQKHTVPSFRKFRISLYLDNRKRIPFEVVHDKCSSCGEFYRN